MCEDGRPAQWPVPQYAARRRTRTPRARALDFPFRDIPAHTYVHKGRVLLTVSRSLKRAEV